jgi:hypothetical protein
MLQVFDGAKLSVAVRILMEAVASYERGDKKR